MNPCRSVPVGAPEAPELNRRRSNRRATRRYSCCVSVSTGTAGAEHDHSPPRKEVKVQQVKMARRQSDVGVGLHKCNRCRKCYSSKSNLKRHVVLHIMNPRKSVGSRNPTPEGATAHPNPSNDKKGVHTCPECGNSYSLRSNLRRHIRNTHETSPSVSVTAQKRSSATTGSRKHRCPRCAKVFTLIHNMKRHLLLHSGTRPSCHVCRTTFSGKDNLTRHLKNLHGIHGGTDDKTCPECKKEFSTRYEMIQHRLIHRVGFKCGLCAKRFQRRDTLINHLHSVHGKGNVAQKIRPPSTSRPVTLVAGQGVSCPQCGLALSSHRCLARHLLVHNDLRPYACRFCEWTFKRRDTLASHLKRLHGKSAAVALSMSLASRRNLNGNGVVGRRSRLVKHQNPVPTRRNGAAAAGRHQCVFCGRRFSDHSNFKRHLHLHTNEQPYFCAKCPLTFTQKKGLTTHLWRSKHEETSKEEALPAQQVQPKRVSTFVARFKCPECGTVLSSRRKLGLHLVK